jgi:hypothetical protein
VAGGNGSTIRSRNGHAADDSPVGDPHTATVASSAQITIAHGAIRLATGSRELTVAV